MNHKTLRFGKGFRVIPANSRSQAAEMVLAPGDTEGERDNRHRGADQWLFVLSGRGAARLKGRTVQLRPGSLLFIERRERHQIRNTGRTLPRTLNFYVPPAYDRRGDPLARGKK